MKFDYSSKSFLTLLSASLLVGSTVNALIMKPTFKDGDNYKNIAIGANVGGSSHYNWVLAIGDELGQRGHNVSFLTSTEDVRFGRPYPNVNTIDIGPVVVYDRVKFMESMSAMTDHVAFMAKSMELLSGNYEREYYTLLSYFEDHKVDLALCDHFMTACFDAATSHKIPYIVTAAMEISSESDAPYINHKIHDMSDPVTEHQRFIQRFKSKIIVPWTSVYKYKSHVKHMTARRRAVGVETEYEVLNQDWKDSMKLVNNLVGYAAPRPVGPMAEYVGPIIPKQYKPLTEELEEYLSSHERVAYIAFGQNAVPSEENIKLILTGILETLERGSLDGFIWATVHSTGLFPDTITTSSGISYNVQDLFNDVNPQVRMVKWAPQTAVLLHPSTTLFVSHGGLGSWYESMYSATPMIMFPFFGDQPGNALTIERSGLGGILKADANVEEAVELFKKITLDETGEIKASVKRIQAFTQIHSDHGVIHGADLVEEVAYTHKDSKLPHRETAARRMSYIKSHNLDLYGALLLMIALTVSVTICTGSKVYHFVSSNRKQQHKMKKL